MTLIDVSLKTSLTFSSLAGFAIIQHFLSSFLVVIIIIIIIIMKTTAPLVEKIVLQVHETPDDAVVNSLQQSARREKNEVLRTKLNDIKNSLTLKTQRAVELASEKGASNWLTVIPIDEMGFTLNKGEFRDAVKLRYDWEIADKPSICVCGDVFNVDHAMVCRRGGFIIQRHNELRDLEADMLSMVCNDVEIEPVL